MIFKLHEEKFESLKRLKKKEKNEKQRKKKEATKTEEVNDGNEVDNENNNSEIEIKDWKKIDLKKEKEIASLTQKIEVLRAEKAKLLITECENKKKHKLKEEAFKKKVLRKVQIITKLHREKNLMKKQLKVEEKRNKKVIKDLKKENKNLKTERKDLTNENNILKSKTVELEFDIKKRNDQNEILKESIEYIQNESHEKDKIIELKGEEHDNEVALLNNVLNKQTYSLKNYIQENLDIKNENQIKSSIIKKLNIENDNLKEQTKEMIRKIELVNSKIVKIQNIYTELNLNTSVIIEKIKKKRKFKLFCF